MVVCVCVRGGCWGGGVYRRTGSTSDVCGDLGWILSPLCDCLLGKRGGWGRGGGGGGFLSTPSTPFPTILCGSSSSLRPIHQPQKTLVISESRLKIQATSGAEIRTKVQDTPLRAWRRLPATPPALSSSTSSFK